MHKNIMEKWVNALRSGKYRKGRNRLCAISKNGNKNWCCLGVLCDLYTAENPGFLVSNTAYDAWTGKNVVYYHNSFTSTNVVLPDKVMKWAGIKHNNGQFTNQRTSIETCLAELNDCKSSKRSFKRMADIIENIWEQL